MAHKSSHRNSYLLKFNDLKLTPINILKTAAKIQKKVEMRVYFLHFLDGTGIIVKRLGRILKPTQ